MLTRGSTGRGPVVTASVGYPEITAVIPPLGQPSAVPGEQVSLLGAGLSAAAVTVLLNHPVLTAPMRIDPDSATGSEVKFTVPAAVPAGFGTVSLALSTPGISDLLSNDVPLGVSPTITSPLPATVAAGGQAAAFAVTCSPIVRAGQQAVLLLDGSPVTAPPVTADTTDLTFTVGPVPAETYPLRLRIDGADSRLIPDRTAIPPVFDNRQSVTVTP